MGTLTRTGCFVVGAMVLTSPPFPPAAATMTQMKTNWVRGAVMTSLSWGVKYVGKSYGW